MLRNNEDDQPVIEASSLEIASIRFSFPMMINSKHSPARMKLLPGDVTLLFFHLSFTFLSPTLPPSAHK